MHLSLWEPDLLFHPLSNQLRHVHALFPPLRQRSGLVQQDLWRNVLWSATERVGARTLPRNTEDLGRRSGRTGFEWWTE